jgi:hypothetical protein
MFGDNPQINNDFQKKNKKQSRREFTDRSQHESFGKKI